MCADAPLLADTSAFVAWLCAMCGRFFVVLAGCLSFLLEAGLLRHSVINSGVSYVDSELLYTVVTAVSPCLSGECRSLGRVFGYVERREDYT